MDARKIKEMQREELEVIQAIYMDDYTNCTTGSAPFLIKLKLTPLQSRTTKDVFASVDLSVQFTTNYPIDSPGINLENEKGLSKDQVVALKKDLRNLASSLRGEVMVLQLAQHVQSYLHQFNKPPSLSFFDQMVVNQQKQEQKLNQEKEEERKAKVSEENEHDQDVIRKVKEELMKREQVLKQEKRKRQESVNLSQDSFSSPLKTIFSCPLSKDRKFSVIVFKGRFEDQKLFCGSCIGHFFDGACCYKGIEESSGKLMSVVEWKPKSQKKKISFSADSSSLGQSDIVKQIQGVEEEFNYLMKLKGNCNGLASYNILEIEQATSGISAKLLMDYIPGEPLFRYMNEERLMLDTVQSISKQLVSILLFLHGKGVVHKNLCLTNTFLCANNKVVVSGYGSIPKISKLYHQYHDDESSINKMGGNFFVLKDMVKIGKKGDVFNLGLLIYALYIGDLDLSYPIEFGESDPSILKDFVENCLTEEETERYSPKQLSNHPFLSENLSGSTSLSITGTPQLEEQTSGNDYNDADVHMPVITDDFVSGKSRLTNEFEIIDWIGKGGFGSVIKVKNKLDGNTYAIKRIKLRPKSLHINKKITREVKLLSRLNHEHVVRYFNSWIEAEDASNGGDDFDSDSELQNIEKEKQQQNNVVAVSERNLEKSLLKVHDIEFINMPENRSSNESWLDITNGNGNSVQPSTSSTSSSDDSSQRIKYKRVSAVKRSHSNKLDSSEMIKFDMEDSMMQFGDNLDSDNSDDNQDDDEKPDKIADRDNNSEMQIQNHCLYIQMECCEINTLRIAIDEGLYKKTNVVWKYFREIVEGMAHVHACGIIHRDLKPTNIFMDSTGKIKIGDFGLATSHVSVKQQSSARSNRSGSVVSTEEAVSGNVGTVSENVGTVSGNVGTVLYIAPEVCAIKRKEKVTHKADMYSLGIILFEMFYKPLETKMERVKVLGLLRTSNITFPDDFPMKQVIQDTSKEICKALLDHCPDNRPGAQELLKSGHIPPKLEDSQLDELLKHTLSQNNSTRYQRLMGALFNQNISPVADQLYDKQDKIENEATVLHKARNLQHVRDVVTNIFQRHNAVFIEVPLLMPKNKFLEKARNAAVYVNQTGFQLCLPYDSRVSFARYVSKNSIFNVKRFYFGRLYREQTIIRAHPNSLWECSYDVISTSLPSFVIEAELLYIVHEIIKEFPKLEERNFYVRLTHTNFLKAIFLQSKLDEEVQNVLLKLLETKNLKELDVMLCKYLTEQNFPDHVRQKLVSFLLFEGTVSQAAETLQLLRKSKPQVNNLSTQAFSEIAQLSQNLNNLCFPLPIQICTHIVPNLTHYNGIFFQVVSKNKKKEKHGGVDILAQGGCYSNLIKSMSKYIETSILPSAVGVSIDIEKVLYSVHENYENLWASLSKCEVLVYVTKSKDLEIMHALWAAEITASIYSYELNQDFSLDELQEHCKQNQIKYLIYFLHTEKEFIRLRSFDREMKKEERFDNIDNLCSVLLTSKVQHKVEKEIEPTLNKSVNVIPLSKISIEFRYASPELKDKDKKTERKKIENSFLLKYRKELQNLFGNKEIFVLVCSIDQKEVKSIAGFLEITGSDEDFVTSLGDLNESINNRNICQRLFDIYKQGTGHYTVILYSYIAEIYKIVGIAKFLN